jgi:hypothetical protein
VADRVETNADMLTNGSQRGTLLVVFDRFVQLVSLQEPVAAVDAVTFKYPRDRVPVDSISVRKVVDGLAGEVRLDELIGLSLGYAALKLLWGSGFGSSGVQSWVFEQLGKTFSLVSEVRIASQDLHRVLVASSKVVLACLLEPFRHLFHSGVTIAPYERCSPGTSLTLWRWNLGDTGSGTGTTLCS